MYKAWSLGDTPSAPLNVLRPKGEVVLTKPACSPEPLTHTWLTGGPFLVPGGWASLLRDNVEGRWGGSRWPPGLEVCPFTLWGQEGIGEGIPKQGAGGTACRVHAKVLGQTRTELV